VKWSLKALIDGSKPEALTRERVPEGEEVAWSNRAVGIVGMGPVGSILGAHLVRSGVEVYGVDASSRRADQVNRDGFFRRGTVQLQESPQRCFTKLAELAAVKDLAAVFLCTKTWAIPTVMKEWVKADWPGDTRIIVFMNGIGPEDAVAEFVPKETVWRGIINYAGNMDPEGWVTMNWFNPPNLIGPASDRVVWWTGGAEEILTKAGLDTVQISHHEMKKEAFFKTILNSSLNALCAAHGLTMGQAMRLRHTRRTARMLLREGLTVAGLVGYNYGEDALDRCLTFLQAGGDHYPSMWFDLRDQRPTEIECINGKIVKIAHMFNDVDVDLNMFFTSAIVTQEIKNGSREEDDIPEYLIEA
jgi:2-dehydropantoate 2-reductase